MWRWSGQASSDTDLSGSIRLERVGWSSGDGSKVVAALEPELTVDGQLGSDTARLRFETVLKGPQILWDTYYGDFSRTATEIEVRVSRSSSEDEPSRWAVDAIARLDDPGNQLELSLQELEGGWSYRGALRIDSLGTFLERYAAGLAELAGGQIAQLSGAGHLAIEAEGRVTRSGGALLLLADGDFSLQAGDQFSMSDASLHGPLELQWELDPTTRERSMSGSQRPWP